MRRAAVLALTLFAVACKPAEEAKAPEGEAAGVENPADLIITGGPIYTVDDRHR